MAFRRVYEMQFEFVWRSLRRLGVPESDVADALQEVFVVVHRRLPEFEGRARLTTWIFRICMNVARSRQKLARTRREVLDPDALGLAPSPGRDPGEQAEQREALGLLEEALGRMPLEQRAAFVLFELEQMTCQEIADTLQIPLGTVYSRIRLARESFQKSVRRAGPRGVAAVEGANR